ncbi:MAG: transketolase, partial [Verrucomicrobia bacterium]|nr:transketolase [Cytophagales bacterium]
MGKAKFGIFGDGKEIAQLAMAKAFRNGDIRSGYYRDQTFMLAIGELTLEQFFAQLYAHTDVNADPATAGRMMNGHFATRMLDENGKWKNLTDLKNSSADVSPTAAQMPRLVGLGYASKLYRNNPELHQFNQFSEQGNEIAFGTIGNASTAEGMFFEAINAAGVLQIPVLVSVWDDHYGISVPNEYQVTKGDISKILSGFQRTEHEKGFAIFRAKGWDYYNLCKVYQKAAQICREEHVPVLLHVLEMTQPQGHSTSGSHERYKSKERLAWEEEFDCIVKTREWILKNEVATVEELEAIENQAKNTARTARNTAWQAFVDTMKPDYNDALQLITQAASQSQEPQKIQEIAEELSKTLNPLRQDAIKAVKKTLRLLRNENIASKTDLVDWVRQVMSKNFDNYSSHLHSQSNESALLVQEIKPMYDENPLLIDGREVMKACFDALFERNPLVVAIGEDVGKIGDVNQAFAGLQEKYGELRITDTGIR